MNKYIATVIGKRVQFFIRPNETKVKKYREPVSVWVLNCKNKAEAEARKLLWETGNHQDAIFSKIIY